MSFREYVGAKVVSLCVAGIGGLYLVLVSYLCGIAFSLIFLLLFSVGLVLILYLVIGWRHTDKRLKML